MLRKISIGIGGGLVLLLFTIMVSLSVGAAEIPLPTVWKIILSKLPGTAGWVEMDWSASEEAIVSKIRMPRVALALLVGVALSIAGVAFQGVLRNPLSDPYILGISSGSALGAASVIFFGWHALFFGWSLPLFAFVGGLLSLAIVFKLSQIQGQWSTHTMILSGVVVQSFFGAMLSFLLSLSGDRLQQIVFWLMGSFSKANYQHVFLLAPYVIVGSIILWCFSKHLNVLALGERQAVHLGMSLSLVKWSVLGVASLITAAAVSVSGTIGFVGLVIPHMVRSVVGANHRWLFPYCAIWGGIFMVICDTAARVMLEPRELPIGVITAFVGAPFFAYLLRKSRNRT